MPFVETFDEFEKRMNCECIGGNWEIGPLQTRQGWLFENGGFSDGQMHINPPEDEIGLAKMQRQYLRYQEKGWTAAFNRLRQVAFDAAKWSGKNVPTISEYHIEELEKIQSVVLELREKLEPLNELLSASPEAIVQEEREQADQANYADRGRLVDLVNQIEI